MNKLLRGLILLGALGLIAGVMALLGSRSSSRVALQAYKAELRAKGENLTYAELTRGRVSSAVDSHAVITNAAARLDQNRLCAALLDPRKYVRPGQAVVTWKRSSLSPMTANEPAGSGTWEELDAQLEPIQSTLHGIREALKNPALDAGPYTNVILGRRVNFVAVRKAGQWLVASAENELHHGRLDAALLDLEALGGLASMEREEYTLVAQMIRVGMAGLGLAATWEALQAPGWTEPQLERLQKAWEPVDLSEAVEKGFLGERAGGDEIFKLVRRSSGSRTGRWFRGLGGSGSASPKWTVEYLLMDHLYLPFYKLAFIDDDELFYLQILQEALRPIQSLKARRPWVESRSAGTNAFVRLNQVARSLGRIRYCVSLTTIPNYTKAGDRAAQTETERQMTLAAIALKRYQLRHGQLPASLEALVPELLGAVPYDCMSAKPLCYHLKADGSNVLYSVGEDGKDDGGDPTPPPGTPASLWGGRDAVWPSPATDQ